MNAEQIIAELRFRADRSSGSGGQHVNKVSTRVTALFSPQNSLALTDVEQKRLLNRLENKLSVDGILAVTCQEHRSQSMNKKTAIAKILALITQAVAPPPPPRKKSKVRKNKAKIRQEKIKTSEKKQSRKKLLPHQFI